MASNRIFAVAVGLNAAYVVGEAFAGLLFGSLALVADAGHNLSDVFGLVLAWGASVLATRAPTQRRTYGWRKSTVLAAVGNSSVLLAAVAFIVWEAVRRLSEGVDVPGVPLIAVAGIGVIVNGATAVLFWGGRGRDLNIRAVFLHMAGDAGVSLAVILAGVGILATGWTWLDPTISVIVALVILWSTVGVLRDALNLALDAVPVGVSLEEIRAYLAALPGVTDVHDLHVWGLSTTETALTAHLVKQGAEDDDAVAARARRELRDLYGVHHVTLQWERQQCGIDCVSSPT